MHETPDDLAQLQDVLDRSDDTAGEYHRSIFKQRISAADLPGILGGVQLINVATVTSLNEPRVAPVDGIFYKGRFHFGSSEGALRFHNIQRNPAISASHVRGEELAILVHGTAMLIDTSAPAHSDFRDCLLEVYGDKWYVFGPGAPYARIEPTKMFAAWMSAAAE